MAFFETKTALGTPSANYDVASEAILISLISVIAKRSEDPNGFIRDIEIQVRARLSTENRSGSLDIAEEILSVVREKTLK